MWGYREREREREGREARVMLDRSREGGFHPYLPVEVNESIMKGPCR